MMEPSLQESLSNIEISESTQILRDKMRNYSLRVRETLRCNSIDALRFGLNEIQQKIDDLENLNEKDVTGLAKRIKRRKHATEEDMYRLSHAFLQSIENIEAFAMIPGAIQVLIKELTGNQVERQLYAAECICNLSLGQAAICEKISNMAGSYLVTYLDSSEPQLKRLCLWSIMNVLETSAKAARILIQMKLLIKLWQIYVAEDLAFTKDVYADCREDAGICLQLIAFQNKTVLSPEDLDFIRKNIESKNPTTAAAEYHLQIIFNCDILVNDELQEQQILYLINFSLRNIKETDNLETAANRLRVVYAVRVLAILLASKTTTWPMFLNQLSSVWHDNLSNIFNKLFDYRNATLTQETLWFLKHTLAYHSKNDSEMRRQFLEQLRVYGPLKVHSTETAIMMSYHF